ncbi:MAG: hypothetical protein F6K10_11025 [Moorea sp. SIO2B7]|nr:hypothetical protein [Moorena sp. SIO2B7]
MKSFDDLPDLFYLGFYHPKYNDYFNEYGNRILDLKNQDYHAINFFLQEFKKKIADHLSDEDIVIATVPPHRCTNPSSGIRDLARRLVNAYQNFSDAVLCLERVQDSNGNRTIANHLNSIKVTDPSIIKGKKVILIDDVLTSGSSIQVCKMLLRQAGAKSVKAIVLGKTIRNVEGAYDFIEQQKDEYFRETEEKSIYEHEEVEKWAGEQYSLIDAEEEYYDREADQEDIDDIENYFEDIECYFFEKRDKINTEKKEKIKMLTILKLRNIGIIKI